MKKIAVIIVLGITLVLVGTRIYSFFVEGRALSASLQDIEARLAKAKYDQAQLSAQAKYLANPLNLEKELRARFNYKKPGETMIIIVPSASSVPSSAVSD